MSLIMLRIIKITYFDFDSPLVCHIQCLSTSSCDFMGCTCAYLEWWLIVHINYPQEHSDHGKRFLSTMRQFSRATHHCYMPLTDHTNSSLHYTMCHFYFNLGALLLLCNHVLVVCLCAALIHAGCCLRVLYWYHTVKNSLTAIQCTYCHFATILCIWQQCCHYFLCNPHSGNIQQFGWKYLNCFFN